MKKEVAEIKKKAENELLEKAELNAEKNVAQKIVSPLLKKEKLAKLEKQNKYSWECDGVPVSVVIAKHDKEFVPIYELRTPKIGVGTRALLKNIKENVIASYEFGDADMLDISKMRKLKIIFSKKIFEIISTEIPTIKDENKKILSGILVQEMLGLGIIEFLIDDAQLEEIVVNNATENIWVYHKSFGWLKTNVKLTDENEIYNFAQKIGRVVGKEITTLNPLMDAHLVTGDRVNASLFPISTKGGTLTIRKFRRQPWTITDLIEKGSLSYEVAAFIWICMEYEISLIVSGGTASGKTSFLGSILPFIPPTQRVISIEDTREIQLPKFLHWVPLTTRTPNPEGKGGVTMLDLLVNSLRMRPDRIVVGEIRRQKEAQVLFEAMHTGHSVYATVHADTAEQTTRRLTSPPIDLPVEEIETLPLIIVMYRHRRKKVRRLFQVAELVGSRQGEDEVSINEIFKWDPIDDIIKSENNSIRIVNELRLHSGMDESDLKQEIKRRVEILQWIVSNDLRTVDEVGRIVSEFYYDKEKVYSLIKKKVKPSELLK
ncbi:MAG: CpaF family protein [Nanoarchaeota archaeon]|nr:CpaF family protein [Nanoarchaeota archaeon]